MDPSTWLSIVSPFYQTVGEVVEELTRRSIAELDTDLLRLKREELTDRFEDARTELARAAELEKQDKVSDLTSRGLGGSNIKESIKKGVDDRAANELQKMHREYNRAIERISLLERKVNARLRWPLPMRWLINFLSP